MADYRTGDKPATIYDVAEAAGVSPSTVSRAFSRPGRVSAKTAARIHQVAAEIGYRSEHVVRTASATESRVIGIHVTDITNPYFFSIIRGAEHVAAAADYTVTISDSAESDDLERSAIDNTLPSLAGIIVANSRLSDTALRRVAKTTPTVLLNRVVPNVHSLITDNARGMRRALEHLAELGHRRVCYVAGPGASWVDAARARSFKEACYELDLNDYRIGPVAPTVRGGIGIFPKLREQHVTAAICYNDMVAIGIMRAAREAGMHIPVDMSIVGFDNTFVSDLVTPGLTSVAGPVTLLGEQAARTVIALANHTVAELPDSNPTVLPMRLIVRDSTGPARRPRVS